MVAVELVLLLVRRVKLCVPERSPTSAPSTALCSTFLPPNAIVKSALAVTPAPPVVLLMVTCPIARSVWTGIKMEFVTQPTPLASLNLMELSVS